MLNVGILGLTGRMGQMISETIESEAKITLIGGTSHESSLTECETIFKQADLLIDFTRASEIQTHLTFAQRHKKPMVIGTTGLSEQDFEMLHKIALEIPLLYATNMSQGVTLMIHLVQQAAAALKDEFDIEIHETHHRHKVDAPSGTALSLGEAAAKGRQINFEDAKQLAPPTSAREKGKIGFSVSRGGEVIGDHNVAFYGDNEIIEVKHRAQNRKIYAQGALKAALFLRSQKPGLYTMRDVLGL